MMASSLTQGVQEKRSQGARTTTYQAGSKVNFTSTPANPSRFQVPTYAATPATGSTPGEICYVGGKLYVCTASPGTWVVVGTQL
jgi:hypothetical protein